MLYAPRTICLHANNKERTSRLITSQSLGQRVKPFMSLEVLKAGEISAFDEASRLSDSGTAIITFLISGEADFSVSTQKQGRLKQGDALWMLSGSGIQYSLTPKTADCVSVKLRVALSPALENAPAQSIHLNSAWIESDGPARVLLGQHGHACGQLAFPALVNYFVVSLVAGQAWTYEPLANHQVAWAAVLSGKIKTSDTQVKPDQIAVYENSHQAINFLAEEDTVFLLGTSNQFSSQQYLYPQYPDQEFTRDLAEQHAASGLNKTFNKAPSEISVLRMCS